MPPTSDTRNLDYRGTRFLTSAETLTQCPPDEVLEAAFVGRSNAGKSSAINALTGKTKLARTSKTPGRTQLLNFFEVEPGRYLVDLPGFGYAKVPRHVSRKWQQELTRYLERRQSLQGLVLLVDVRHLFKDFDTMIVEWAHQAGLPLLVLLTKADKLKRGAAGNALLKARKQLENYGESVTVELFSAHSGQGVDALSRQLDEWLGGAVEIPG